MAKPNIKVISLNVSETKGTIKSPVDTIQINDKGIVGDAHAGDWHRQVSLLGVESFAKMTKGKDITLDYGVFAENITTEGIALHKTAVFDRFENDEVILEVTQIGKKCHKGCEIMKKVGDCVMPREGIFCRVIKGGKVSVGDNFSYNPRIIKAHVITLSDRAYKGIYEDLSGPEAAAIMESFFKENNRHFNIKRSILPDDPKQLEKAITESCDDAFDIIITTGGTGIGKRDFTPQVIQSLIDIEVPGIMDHIRLKYGATAPNALTSRSIAGVKNNTLIYAIPGSVKAVKEYLFEINKTIEHSFRMLNSIDNH